MNEPARRNRGAVVAVIAAAVLLAAAGTFFVIRSNNDKPSSTPTPTPSATPTGTSTGSPTPTPTATPTAGAAVAVYWVGNAARGQRLFRELEPGPACSDQNCRAAAAVTAAVSGTAIHPGYRSLWPLGTKVGSVSYNGDVLTVDLTGNALHDRPAGMTAAQAGLAVQQVLYTAQTALKTGPVPVQLLLNGKHSDQILGVATSEPLAAAKADDVMALVSIDSPAQNETVTSPVTVTGQAATFEANVVWEVLGSGGTVVKKGFTTAAECCTLAPYRFTVILPPGSYTIRVHDTDESGQGRPVNSDTRAITVK